MNDAVSSGQPVTGAGSGPGAALLAERRRQNLSLGDVSRQLKLSVRQVEALERDDYSGFQGPVFVHGFMRNYAKLLALDPNPLIRAADRLLSPAPAPLEPEAATAIRDAPKAGKSLWPAATGVGAVLLIAGLMMFMDRGERGPGERKDPAGAAGEQGVAATDSGEKHPPARLAEKPVVEKAASDSPEESPTGSNVREKAIAAKPAKQPEQAAEESLPGPVADAGAVETGPRMTIRMIFEQESWVEIKDRYGNTVFGQLNAAGTRRSASGEPPLSIVVGNAAGVRLFQGEKSIDLAPHTRVDVARLTVE
jgi:cytoskeleton protein RodZ